MTEDITTRMLALRPWDGLDHDAASGAVHPAHGIGERDGNVPNGDEFELPGLGHAIVSRTMLAASGASGFAIGPWDDFGDDAHRIARAAQADGVVNEALDAVDFVELGLEKNRWPPGWFVVVNEICQRLPVHQALMPSADHQRQEEKVVHNSPLRGGWIPALPTDLAEEAIN